MSIDGGCYVGVQSATAGVSLVSGGGHGSTVVGGGVFRCCVPWCGARAAAPVDDAGYALRGETPPTTLEEYGKFTIPLLFPYR